MASMKTCPHKKDDRLMLSGTVVRKTLSEGGKLPVEFSRPEVAAVLTDYYQKLDKKVEIKLHGAATGDVKKS
jgi:sulfate adenylyltransferase